MKATADWLNATNRRYIAGTASSVFVHLGQYTAELREAGSGPPIVLIPGLAGGLELLGPLARSLALTNHVFTYQLRGENDCFSLRHPFGLDDLVEDLAELLDSLCLEKPTIMGLSFGGIIALKFAIRYPYRLGRLIVQGAGARYERGLIQQIASTVLSRFPLPADSPFVNQFFNLLFGGRQKQDGLFDFVTRQIWQTDQSVMAHRFRLVEELDIEDHLRHIKASTLVLSGERDVLVSQTSLTPLVHQIPDVRSVRLPNCGHLAFVTKPEAIVKSVEQFLET
ncbi:MAG: alpha/beta hydrolase [Gemmataceae bacterium]|nr:alpha/beta hydrolase [Gemmataceae bacterium]